MHRRLFLQSGLAAPLLSAAPGQSVREYYQIRKFSLENGPQTKLTDTFVAESFIPALNKMGISPVGAFNVDIGPETPTLYLLIPSESLEKLVSIDLTLSQDADFVAKTSAFWSAPAKEPAFLRAESSLLIAFEGRPKLKTPPKGNRVFQLRTYESPSYADHVRKIEMFHAGEFEIFERAGFWPVFYADTLIGTRMPSLTYMVSFPDVSGMNAKWNAFFSDPEWKKLVDSPRYSFEPTVSNITNLILKPTSYSQI